MQLPNDQELAAAILQPRRDPIIRLQVDWDGDGTFDHPESNLTPYLGDGGDIEIERALTTDTPAEVSLVDGYSVANLRATLSGKRRGSDMAAHRVFAPGNPDSPLFGTRLVGKPTMRLDVGLKAFTGQKWLRQFTGPVRKVDPGADGLVQIEGLDPADRLRSPITLPRWFQMKHRLAVYGGGVDVNSQWLYDYCLRQCGVFAGPRVRPGTIVSVTGHGGIVAETGFSDRPGYYNGTAPLPAAWKHTPGGMWYPGPHGLLAMRGRWDLLTYQDHYATEGYNFGVGTGIGMQGWVDAGGANSGNGVSLPVFTIAHTDTAVAGGYAQGAHLFVSEAGALRTGFVDGTGIQMGPFLPQVGAAGFRFVGLHFYRTAGGQITLTWRIDGQSGRYTFPRAVAFAGLPVEQMRARISNVRGWSDFSVFRLDELHPTTGTWVGEVHTPEARIGRGLNHWQYLPREINRDAWELMCEVNAAEFGVLGLDEYGTPEFRARTANNGTGVAVVKDIRADHELLDLRTPVTVDSVRNVIGTENKGGTIAFNSEKMWELEDYLDPYWRVRLGRNDYDIPIPDGWLPRKNFWITGFDASGWNAVRANRAQGFATCTLGGGNLVGTGAYLRQTSAHMLTLTINNPTGQEGYIAAPGGGENGELRAALIIDGFPMNEEGVDVRTYRDEDSIERYGGERTLQLEASHWRQQPQNLGTVAAMLLEECSEAVPLLSDIPIVGDPRLQLGDVVRLVDPRGLVRSLTGRVVKINRKASTTEGLRDTIAIRPFASSWRNYIGA